MWVQSRSLPIPLLVIVAILVVPIVMMVMMAVVVLVLIVVLSFLVLLIVIILCHLVSNNKMQRERKNLHAAQETLSTSLGPSVTSFWLS